MSETAMAKFWPSGLDKGAESQFSLLEYRQPPAREATQSQLGESTPSGLEATPELAKKDEKQSEDVSKPVEKENKETSVNIEDAKGEKASVSTNKNNGNESSSVKIAPSIRTSSPTPSSNNQKGYYEFPDLKVIVKGQPDESVFLVSSYALCMASKVWRTKLNPQNIKDLESHQFGASSDETIKVIYVDDVDPLSLDIIFQVIHLKTNKLPQTLPFDSLRKLAIACDKYDCGRALNPWPLVWMEEYESLATTPGFEDWIFIAHALDTRNTKSREISSKMVLEASSVSKCGSYLRRDVRGTWVPAHTVEVNLDIIPSAVLEYVQRERTKAIDSITSMLRQFVGDITDGDYGARDGSSFGLAKSELCESEACLNIALGSLLRSLKALNLWPLLRSGSPLEWHGSVTTLVMQVETLKMTTFVQKVEPPNPTTSDASRRTGDSPGSQFSEATNPSNVTNSPPGSGSIRETAYSPEKASSSSKSSSQRTIKKSHVRKSILDSEHVTRKGEIAVNIRIMPAPTFPRDSIEGTSRDATPSQDATSQSGTIFRELLYSKSLGDSFAATTNDLRYEYPAFQGSIYRDDIQPCATAFALGELITNCRKIVMDIAAGGYRPGL